VVRKIQKADFHFKAKAWSNIGEGAKDFVKQLIKVEPTERLSAEAAMEHTWLAEEWERTRKLSSKLSSNSSMNGEPTEGSKLVESLRAYGSSSKLRKTALMVVAHRAESKQIKEIREAFLEMDTSKEGTITLAELKAVLEQHDMSGKEIEDIFTSMDVDGAGVIGYTEFLAATVEMHGEIKSDELLEAFDRLDADDSGFISESNLKELLGSAYNAEEVKKMIADADFKKNGQVDFDEFLQLMHVKRGQDVAEVKTACPEVKVPAPDEREDTAERKSSG